MKVLISKEDMESGKGSEDDYIKNVLYYFYQISDPRFDLNETVDDISLEVNEVSYRTGIDAAGYYKYYDSDGRPVDINMEKLGKNARHKRSGNTEGSGSTGYQCEHGKKVY